MILRPFVGGNAVQVTLLLADKITKNTRVHGALNTKTNEGSLSAQSAATRWAKRPLVAVAASIYHVNRPRKNYTCNLNVDRLMIT
jgi:hypothetical protein